MVNIGKFLKKIFIGEKPEIKHVEVDPESVKQNALIKAQQHQIAELQGLLVKSKMDETSARESEKDVSEEQIIKEQLRDQELEIRKVSAGKGFSMKTFWASYFGVPIKDVENPKTKLAKALKYVTFDRGSDIAPFDDIVFSGNNICLTSKKNKIVVLRGERLQEIFESTNALARDVASGMIPINLDKEGGYVENLMVWKPAEVSNTEDGLKYKSANKVPLYKYLQEKEEQINDLREELEHEELTNVELQSKVNDLQLAIKLSSKSSEIANNEKSKMIDKVSEVEKALGRMEQDLTRLQTVSVMDNDNIMKLQNQADSLRKEAEKIGGTPAFMEALENIERIASVLTNKEVLTKSKTEEVKV